MATGPEHYAEAEALLEQAGEAKLGSDRERFTLAAAQVHATLALTAATADAGWRMSYSPRGGQAWRDAGALA